MKNRAKQKWLAALRSDQYTQTKGVLRSGGNQHMSIWDDEETEQEANPSYCCLGVLCEVYREATGDGTWQNARFIDNGEVDRSGMALLPRGVANWAGLSVDDQFTLADNNDWGEIDFHAIADIIEAFL